MMPRQLSWLAAVSALLIAGRLFAAVPAEEAARLKTDLTPFGAERAGNKEGTIPAWTGGYTTVWPGYQSGQPRPDPFADEKPLFQITAANMDQYADELSGGIKALLQRFPTYRLDVYTSHRTAAAPQHVYDETFNNATRAMTGDGGLSVRDVYGGIPFPVPKNGYEVMWNNAFAWRGESVSYYYSTYIAIAGKKPTQSAAAILDVQYPYYYAKIPHDRQIYFFARQTVLAPPFRAGQLTIAHEPVDQYNDNRKAWQYLVGQRRVRRAPYIAYDNPSADTAGMTYVDETYLFSGSLDRYEWALVGKQEMVVPYNNNGFHTRNSEQVIGANHIDPDSVRWERHRVWVVEARLAEGKRHVIPRRRLYLDEDTWQVLLADGWDANGQLWHVGHTVTLLVPELPSLITATYVVYDLAKGGYAGSTIFNDGDRHWQTVPLKPEDYFSPSALVGEGIR